MAENKPPKKRKQAKKTVEKAGFDKLELSRAMRGALQKAGYTEPSPIQAGLIPKALEGLDVVGQARTGTGKTAAFAIPMLEQLAPPSEIHEPQVLVLVPTRELAVQVREEFEKLGVGQSMSSVAVYGGKPIRNQIQKLQSGAQVVVGTPGRVLDLISRRSLKLEEVWGVVLDEADRMLDIGFRPDIERILKRCNHPDRQTLLLSATVPPPIARLAERYMKSPISLDFSTTDLAVETIEQFYFTVDPQRKFPLLVQLLEREDPRQAIVFCRTKRGTERIFRQLSKAEKGVDCMHGDMQQSARNNTMRRFRAGSSRILVATDVVGRGIDVTAVSHIINYDTPTFCDDYVHRVGRTGRMGREGVAYTFVCPEEGGELTRIEQRINRQLKRDEIKGFSTIVTPDKEETDVLEQEGDPPPEPPSDAMRRRPKRYRRAL